MSDQTLGAVLQQRFVEASEPESEERVATLATRAQAGGSDSFRQLQVAQSMAPVGQN